MTIIIARKKYLIAIMVIVCLLPAWQALADQKISIEKKGTYIYWITFTNADGARQATAPQRFKGSETEVDPKSLGDKFSDAKLYILDKRTGNIAIADYPFPEKDAKPIELGETDFAYVPSVKLNVVSKEGEPVESALVTLVDGNGTSMTAVITPADTGTAIFRDVATGDAEVSVKAKGVKKTIDGEFEIPEKRKASVFEREIKVSGDIQTIKVAVAPVSTGDEARPEPKATGAAGVLQSIVGLIFVILVVAIIYVVLKSRGVTAKSALGKIGAEFPEDQQAQAGMGPTSAGHPFPDPNMCAFCGQMKDAAGDCACSLASGTAPYAVQMERTSGPRLIGSQGVYSGAIFEITGATATIGRDSSNEVALPNDTTASRRHATITATGGAYSIRDEGSSNGTFVNGAQVTEQKLSPGDEVQVGGTKFRFET